MDKEVKLPLRIRLPNDYSVKSTEPLKPFLLEDYSVMLDATVRFAACKEAEKIMRDDVLKAFQFYGPLPEPTRWEKFKYRMQDYSQRFKDMWTILKGDDIHKDCW